jgi:hypothetical protein
MNGTRAMMAESALTFVVEAKWRVTLRTRSRGWCGYAFPQVSARHGCKYRYRLGRGIEYTDEYPTCWLTNGEADKNVLEISIGPTHGLLSKHMY